jgi:N-acetylmuramoyl-L-alanine amidase
VSGYPIINLPTAPRERVLANLPDTVHPRFVDEMFPVLWAAALEYGIDPVGMVAQSGKETKWGDFMGQVLPQFYNTAGIKIRHQSLFPGITDGDRPLAHQMFPNWTVGAMAHAQHLRIYAGKPVLGLVVDPRYHLVGPPPVSTWAELGGRWAPSLTYGLEIEAIMNRLRMENT